MVFNSQSLIFTLKRIRHISRRIKVKLHYGSLSGSPILFANGFPKSGTHLLTQVLGGFTKLGPAVDAGLPAIVTFVGTTGKVRSTNAILKDLRRLGDGDIAFGHLHAIPEVVSTLTGRRFAPFFIYRDPRDVVVSHVHYVTEMETTHVHHHYYADILKTLNQRIKVSILGRPESDTPFPDICKRFEPYLGWLEEVDVLSLRFEDFINLKSWTLERILDHAIKRGFELKVLRAVALESLDSAINPKNSPTYRSGKVGRWRESFNEENKAIFKEVAGDLLIQLGYEGDNDW